MAKKTKEKSRPKTDSNQLTKDSTLDWKKQELLLRAGLLGKLNKIMSDVQEIKKDAVNEFHNYRYASEYAIKDALHPLLVKHGVLMMVGIKCSQRAEDITKLEMDYEFFDTSTGYSIRKTFFGEGQDKGDKGTYKAITGAIKYILTSTFLIPTGDDPEKEARRRQTARKGLAPKAATQGSKCEICGTTGEYHKKGCPNTPKTNNANR